jgi:hypothetical protein
MKRTLALALLALVAGCSQSTQQSSQSAASSASAGSGVANPIDFPLYAQSTVLSARDFKQRAGSTTIVGTEVIAENPASLNALNDWLKSVGAAPPNGYALAPSNNSIETGRAKAASLGIDFAVFTHTVDGKRRGLIVMAVDPATFDEKAGPVLGYVSKFKLLPQPIRDSIDGQVKERTGYTVSEALDPATPIGGALAAVTTLQSSGQRGIVLIDGTKN